VKSKVFGMGYADQYDFLYEDKDYESECDVLEEIFKRYSKLQVHTILDLGCGTGNHLIPLARRGYHMTGVDLSEEMLSRAREKADKLVPDQAAEWKEPALYKENLRRFEIDKKFDVALMMFAVLGYQLENAHLVEALQTVRKHLRPGGLFVFDVWYGPAVLSIRPNDRVKVIKTEEVELIRAAYGSLDVYHQLAKVHYHIWRIQEKRVISESEEDHLMRYFFPQELAYFLHEAGLDLISLTEFPSLDRIASENSWNVLGICKNTLA
jgi:SAM-dependent methyltransferase